MTVLQSQATIQSKRKNNKKTSLSRILNELIV